MGNDFRTSARQTLRFLHNRLGFGLWMVTRVDGDDWIVLSAEDHGYQVTEGTVFRWADSFCSRMVQGLGPKIAPDSDAIPAYAVAPIGRQVSIGAYVGVPLRQADGSLFGTLCAIDRSPQPAVIQQEQGLVELLAGLLSGLLSAELKASEAERRTERAEAELMRDSLTSLYGRRGWDQLLAAEEDRCSRYGHPAAVLSIDLDGLKFLNDTQGHAAGDDLLLRAGRALSTLMRPSDIVARIGGDEFAVLASECDAAGTQRLLTRVRDGLARAGVRASIGAANRHAARGLAAAWEEADAEMYRNKRHAKRTSPEHNTIVESLSQNSYGHAE
jgi:diguanylate cyclase (GGDEF)-like protein